MLVDCIKARYESTLAVYLGLVLFVVDVGQYQQAHNAPWHKHLSFEAVAKRLPALHEGLEYAFTTSMIASEHLRSWKHAQVHFRRDSHFEVEVFGVQGDSGSAVLQTCVGVSLVLEVEAHLELLDGDLERGDLLLVEALKAAETGVDDDDNNNWLELLGGNKAEHYLLVLACACALVVHHSCEGCRYAKVYMVREIASMARCDDAKVEQLRNKRVCSANNCCGLL